MDCPDICVSGPTCDFEANGADFVFVIDSSHDLNGDTNVINFLTDIIVNVIPNPSLPDDSSGQLGILF